MFSPMWAWAWSLARSRLLMFSPMWAWAWSLARCASANRWFMSARSARNAMKIAPYSGSIRAPRAMKSLNVRVVSIVGCPLRLGAESYQTCRAGSVSSTRNAVSTRRGRRRCIAMPSQ